MPVTSHLGWRRIAGIMGIALCIGLTLLPIINTVIIIATTGADTLSNDYVDKAVVLVDKVFSGGYDWRNYFVDSFQASHCYAIPFLIMIGVAYFFDWNQTIQLYLCVMLGILTLILLQDACGRLLGRRLRWLLWPALSALLFSASRIENFTYGYDAPGQGLALLGTSLGIWGLVRWPDRWLGVGLMALGGIIASWSRANGMVDWPVFLAGLVLLRSRRVSYYVVWFVTAALAALPFIWRMVFSGASPDAKVPWLFLSRSYFLNLLGRPFANNIGTDIFNLPEAERAAWVGCALLIGMLALLWYGRGHWRQFARFVPGLLLVLLGLLGVYQTAVFRAAGRSIAPWYTGLALPFWLGLVGLAWANGAEWWAWRRLPAAGAGQPRKGLALCSSLWSVVFVAALLYLYCSSNLTYRDKTITSAYRSPASAACLRHYRTAPTYCENAVFLWGVGNPSFLPMLAWPLERHRLSVFAPHQEWTLQGDYVLAAVRLAQSPDVLPIAWYTDLQGEQSPWSDYRRLNLLLVPPNAISWTINLPQNTQAAEFNSAIGLSPLAPPSAAANGATFAVYIEPQGETRQLVFQQAVGPGQHTWLPVSLPLSQYRGRQLTLHLTTQGEADATGAWAMYRYPLIDLTLNEKALALPEPVVVPDNTDLSPFFPGLADEDFRLDGTVADGWGAANLQPVPNSPGTWTARWSSLFYPQKALNLCLADYSHFYLRLAAAPEIQPRAIQIAYRLRADERSDQTGTADMPLLADGALHTYTYDLKLLDPPAPTGTRLLDLRLRPIYPQFRGEGQIQFAEAGLLRRQGPTRCGSSGRAAAAGAAELWPPEIPPEMVIGEVTTGIEVAQTFVSHCAGLSQLELATATYIRVNTQPLIVRLTEAESGKVAAEQAFAGPAIPDNSWITMQMKPMPDSRGKAYRLIVRSPNSVPGNAVTVYRSLTDVYAGGAAFINGSPLNADLAFRYRCTP